MYFCLSLPICAMEVKLSTLFLQESTGRIKELILDRILKMEKMRQAHNHIFLALHV